VTFKHKKRKKTERMGGGGGFGNWGKEAGNHKEQYVNVVVGGGGKQRNHQLGTMVTARGTIKNSRKTGLSAGTGTGKVIQRILNREKTQKKLDRRKRGGKRRHLPSGKWLGEVCVITIAEKTSQKNPQQWFHWVFGMSDERKTLMFCHRRDKKGQKYKHSSKKKKPKPNPFFKTPGGGEDLIRTI